MGPAFATLVSNLICLTNDAFLLSEFKKALLQNASHPVINLDEKFPHRIDLFAEIFENIIDKVGNQVPPHKWSHYRLGLIKEGAADYTCGIYKFRARANTLLIIPPRVVNSSSNWTPDSKGYLLLFNLHFFLQSHFPYQYLENKNILQPSVQPYLRLTPEQADSVEEIFKTILQENNSNHPHKSELIAVKILELLILVERIYVEIHSVDNDPVSYELVSRFAKLVETNVAKERSVSYYASVLHVHPNYLNAVVKEHSGMTAKETIQNRLVLEAKYLLNSTTLSVKEIADQLGFDDPNYFGAMFKRREGLSPVVYRNTIL